VAFSCTDFHTTLYFVNQRNYKTLAMQSHALTRTRYFYSLNVIISHPIGHKEGLGHLSVCAVASRSFPPSHVCIYDGQRSSELFCVHCSLVEMYRRFRGTCCLHHQDDHRPRSWEIYIPWRRASLSPRKLSTAQLYSSWICAELRSFGAVNDVAHTSLPGRSSMLPANGSHNEINNSITKNLHRTQSAPYQMYTRLL
jgi:hypothetical protein